MRVFRNKDGRILQLADKDQIAGWSPEFPLIFIGNVKDNRIPVYKNEFDSDLVKEVEDYLDEILKDVAIPKLIKALKSDDTEERKTVAENFVEISDSNPDQLKIALPHIKQAIEEEKDQEIIDLMKKAIRNYEKAQKRKQTAKKRAKLRKLRRKMDEIDRDYADGKISDDEYLQKQKEYVQLKREIELAEQVD